MIELFFPDPVIETAVIEEPAPLLKKSWIGRVGPEIIRTQVIPARDAVANTHDIDGEPVLMMPVTRASPVTISLSL